MIAVLLCVPLLLYLPGVLISWAAYGRGRPDDILERHYERVAIGALLNGWLALLLAEFGVFSLWLHITLLVLCCVSLALVVWRRGLLRRSTQAVRPSRRQLVELIAFALVGGVAFALVARPFEVVLGVRDAGVYANTGFAIARTGGIVQYDPLLADLAVSEQSHDPATSEAAAQALTNFIGVQNTERFIATKLRAVGFFVLEGDATKGRVVPQGLHLLPAWIALLTSIGGLTAGLWAPCLLGLLGAWSVGMLGRRLGGFWVGLLAFLFLALNSTQVWFSRYSTAETAMQFLVFAGLYFFVKFCGAGTEDREPRTEKNEESTTSGNRTNVRGRSPVSGLRSPVCDPSSYYAALAGIAFGQIGLARLDYFLASSPLWLLLGYLLYRTLTRRWQRGHTVLALALGVLLVHAMLHILFIARAYFFDTVAARLRDSAITATLSLPFLTETMRQVTYTTTASPLKNPWRLWLELAAVTIAIGGLVLLRRYPRPLWFGERLLRRWGRLLLNLSALAIVVFAGWAYLVRPGLLDGDMLFNTRGGWSDPLSVDPVVVQQSWVQQQRIDPAMARQQFGVVLDANPQRCSTTMNVAATEAMRIAMRVQRGPWRGPFSNQSVNWLRLQGYIGAPIAVPWCDRAVYAIPLANLVRVGWYLSPLGITLGVIGFALWWRRMGAASWLFLAIGLLSTFLYVRQTYGASDQSYIYILRRFVPTVYPAFSLGMAYAIVALAAWTKDGRRKTEDRRQVLAFVVHPLSSVFRPSSSVFRLPSFVAGVLALALTAFFLATGRPIYAHTEYSGADGAPGAVEQISSLAARFVPGDIVLLRGGGPGFERDLPDLVATPLRFAFGVDALTVKSRYPGSYASALAAQVGHWQTTGHRVFVAYSSSGGDFTLPGFQLTPAGNFDLRLNEFEQLQTQKPRNVQQLSFPLGIYQLTPGKPGVLATLPVGQPITPTDFAAQVSGFYRPELRPSPEGVPFVWTDGNGLLRLPTPTPGASHKLTLHLAGGQRPAQIGPAQVCFSLYAEQSAEASAPPPNDAAFTPLGCQTLKPSFDTYTVPLDMNAIGPTPVGSVLLRLESPAWVPADEDARQLDQRPVGIQFASLSLGQE